MIQAKLPSLGRPVRPASKRAFIDYESGRAGRAGDVLRAMRQCGDRPATAGELTAQMTDIHPFRGAEWQVALLRTRRALSDLQHDGEIESAGETFCDISGRTVTTWRIKI